MLPRAVPIVEAMLALVLADHRLRQAARWAPRSRGELSSRAMSVSSRGSSRSTARTRAEVRARHLIDLFHKLRTDRERNFAQRTIYNIYAIISALFRDAKLADLIEQSPCVLDERQLGPVTDKDPEWRNAAVFTHEEVETIISDARIHRRHEEVLELLAKLGNLVALAE